MDISKDEKRHEEIWIHGDMRRHMKRHMKRHLKRHMERHMKRYKKRCMKRHMKSHIKGHILMKRCEDASKNSRPWNIMVKF